MPDIYISFDYASCEHEVDVGMVQHFNYFFHRPPFPPPPPPIYLSLVVEGFVCINKMGGETTPLAGGFGLSGASPSGHA